MKYFQALIGFLFFCNQLSYSQFSEGVLAKQYKDTSLSLIHFYDKVYQRGNHNTNLGNNATIPFPFYIEIQKHTSGFESGFDKWSFYNYLPNTISYYQAEKPLTDLSFSQGPNEFYSFDGLFSYSVKPNANFTIGTKRLGSNGYYANNEAFSRHLNISGWYKTLNNQYKLSYYGLWNYHRQQENGGITDRIFFEETGSQGVSVKLQSAYQENRSNYFGFNQEFNLGKKDTISKIIDSVSKSFDVIKTNKWFIGHQFDFHKIKHLMFDTASDTRILGSIYDTLKTRNLYLIDKYTNQFYLKFIPNNYLNNLLGVKVELFSSYSNILKTQSNNIIPYLDIRYTNQSQKIRLYTDYVLSGYNAKDWVSHLQYEKPILNRLIINANLEYAVFSPSLQERMMRSNRFFWDNQFKQTISFTPNISLYDSNQNGISVKYHNITNYIYMNEVCSLIQYKPSIQVLEYRVRYKPKIGILTFDNHLLYNQIIIGNNVLRIPRLSYQAGFYLSKKFFKNNLLTNIGADIRITNQFTSYNYVPGIGGFALQDSLQIGGYPFTDVWAGFQIKKFQFHVKVEQTLANINTIPVRYYSLALYPNYPTTIIRLGIRWRFSD